MTLGDLGCLLRQNVRSQLVGGRVLPLASMVRRFAGLLRSGDLMVSALPESREQELIDLTALRLSAGLPGAALEGAHHASFDHPRKAFEAKGFGANQRQPAVSVGPRGSDQLMMRGAQALAVEVADRAEAVEDGAPRCDAPVRRDGQHLMDPTLELGAGKELGQQPAQGAVEVERAP